MQDIDDQEGTAAYLGVPARTLEDWRYKGRGPAFCRVGKHVRYRREDVEAWLESQRVTPEAA